MENLERLNRISPKFWANKKVFITGHTGFKGSWLSFWLQHLGANLKGYSLSPNTDNSLFIEGKVGEHMESQIGDIRDLSMLKKSINNFKPDILIHLAAQPLVRESYINPVETYSTNVMGTVNVLEAAKSCDSLKAVLAITTDKCYENKEWYWGYREIDPMGGHDPYSSSKGCCELIISSYRSSFFSEDNTLALASARAGNVIGGGDWSSDRLIPDILKSFEIGKPAIIRNPKSVRPWQHVIEPLSAYLVLCEKLFNHGNKYAEAWNFGPTDEDCKPVSHIVDLMIKYWGNKSSWKIDDKFNPHEAQLLKLDCSKAAQKLNWIPKWNLENAIKNTVEWHKEWLNGGNIKIKSINQIKEYNKYYNDEKKQ